MLTLRNHHKMVYWDFRLAWASTYYFLGALANTTIKMVLPVSESLWNLVSIITGLAILLGYIISFKKMMSRVSQVYWITMALFVGIYSISLILCLFRGEEIDQLIRGTAFSTFVWWLPTGAFACSVKNKNILYKVWLRVSYIISALCILIFIFHRVSHVVDYSLPFGSMMIIALLFHCNEFLKQKNGWFFLLIVIEFSTILVYANRGILLALIFFLAYKFVIDKRNDIKLTISFIITLIVSFLLWENMIFIAKYTNRIFNDLGLNSRTLSLMANGMIAKTSGRDEIWDICIKMIEDRPLLGWGLGGEYYHIAHELSGTAHYVTKAFAYNPHNGIIQNFVCFGVVVGMIVNVIILYPLLQIKNIYNKGLHDMLLIFASIGVIPLCVSSAGFFVKPETAIYLFLYYGTIYFQSQRTIKIV